MNEEQQAEYEQSLDDAEAVETNNCDKCGVELDGPWDDMCEPCEAAAAEYDTTLDPISPNFNRAAWSMS